MLLPSFLLFPLLASLSASVAGGIVGSYVVVRKISFISGSISHAVLGGMGLFLFLQRHYGWDFFSPLQGAICAALACAALLGWIHLRYKEREDSIIAALWATGMAVGVIFITLTPGYNVELMNFLFGNVLWITKKDLIILLLLDLLVLSSILLFYRKFQAICFDEEQAALQGICVKKMYILLLCLIALSVVVLIQVVGSVLVISMLTLPAATAAGRAKRLSTLMKSAVGLSMIFACLGVYASYYLDWPPGATITLISAGVYGLALVSNKYYIRKCLT